MKIETRKQIYNKYSGHCAYCGKEISFKEMQVDHIQPKAYGGTDDISNLNPSCRLCNHYKRNNTLESWRNWELGGLIDRLQKIYIFRVALAFGMIEVKGFDKRFFFEKIKHKDK